MTITTVIWLLPILHCSVCFCAEWHCYDCVGAQESPAKHEKVVMQARVPDLATMIHVQGLKQLVTEALLTQLRSGVQELVRGE